MVEQRVLKLAQTVTQLPAAILTTSRLCPLHLTPDNLHLKGMRVAAIEVYADTLLENPQLLWKCPMGVRKFAALPPELPILMAIRDPAYLDHDLPNGEGHVSVENVAGVMRLGVADYWRLGPQWGVDAQLAPLDHHRLPASTKRIRKSLDRTLRYLDLAPASSTLPECWLNVPGGDSLALRLEAVDRLIAKCPEAKAFAFAGLESARWPEPQWLEAITQLLSHLRSKVSDAIVYLRGTFKPAEIRQLISLGVDLFDTSYVDSLTAQSMALGDETNLNMADDIFFNDLTPLSNTCQCFVCRQPVTRSYIHHLVRTEEMLASVYLQAHNLQQFLSLFK